MKKLTTNVILWAISLLTFLLALGGFSQGALAGILFLIAAILTNPIFLKFLRKHHLRFKKKFYIPAVVLIWLVGVSAIPTSESNDSVQTQAESSEELITEIAVEDDIDTNEEIDINTNKEIDITEETDTVAFSELQDTDSDIPASNPDSELTADSLSELSVHFIDVGQGDATLILCDNHAMLIDSGDNSKGTTLQLYLNKQGVEKLDYLVLTHPDADHIGGADVIITKYDIDTIFMSDYPEDTKTYEEVLDALYQKNKKWSVPSVGDTYTLGDAAFTILAPLDNYSNSNDSSIALMLTHGENKFLFTGDCSENAEDDLTAGDQDLSANVYQVGHHGSRYSSSQTFMDAVSPTYAVISCGEDNSYGHPSAEALNRFRAMGIQVFRTDEQGSIVATSDGENIAWNCAPSDTWKAGESTMSASASSQSDNVKTDITDHSGSRKSASDQTAAVSNTQDAMTTTNASVPDTQDTKPTTNASVSDTQATAGNVPDSNIQNTVPAENTTASSDTTITGGSGSGTNPFETGTSPGAGLYIGNKNNGKLHLSTCHKLPKNENQAVFNTREEAVAAGYNDPCKLCKP